MSSRFERLNTEDFETASIRSAAPSYSQCTPLFTCPPKVQCTDHLAIVSDAPSYHSTLPPNESLPSYAHAQADAPPRHFASSSTSSAANQRSMIPPATGSSMLYGPGLPPVSDLPPRSQMPQLNEFRIPTWSTLHSNPTARHYQNVAHRRASRGGRSNEVQMQGALRAALGRLNEQEEEREQARHRPLEDPYLVGEEAAARARRARLARENGDEILIREDRRWDWFLGMPPSTLPVNTLRLRTSVQAFLLFKCIHG